MYYESISMQHIFHNKTPLALFFLCLCTFCWTTCHTYHNRSISLSYKLYHTLGMWWCLLLNLLKRNHHCLHLHHLNLTTDAKLQWHHQFLSFEYCSLLTWFFCHCWQHPSFSIVSLLWLPSYVLSHFSDFLLMFALNSLCFLFFLGFSLFNLFPLQIF